MAYALGRRVEYSDQPTVRSITDSAAQQDYRMSAFVIGVVKSDAFRLKRASGERELSVSEARHRD